MLLLLARDERFLKFHERANTIPTPISYYAANAAPNQNSSTRQFRAILFSMLIARRSSLVESSNTRSRTANINQFLRLVVLVLGNAEKYAHRYS